MNEQEKQEIIAEVEASIMEKMKGLVIKYPYAEFAQNRICRVRGGSHE